MANGYDTLVENDPRLDRVVEIESDAFGGIEDSTRRFVENAGPAACRVWEDGSTVQGALLLYEMGQWFGGRSVPMWGVAGVAIDSTYRGRGVGTRLMSAAVREMHERGIALSALFPAVQPLYRRLGYEIAGNLYSICLKLREIAPIDRTCPLREGTPDDEPALEEFVRQRGRISDGTLDRSELMWKRAREPRGEATRVHLVEEDGAITGYVRWRRRSNSSGEFLDASDVIATTPTAARRLLAFFADQAAQVDKTYWFGHPTDALCRAAASICTQIKIGGPWMLRLTHVESALTARGYAPGIAADVHLELTDDLCPGNAGRWRILVEDGRARVERGGDGRIAMDVRTFAAIYSGHAHPMVIRAADPIAGSDNDLATLGAVFAGGDPWIQDPF